MLRRVVFLASLLSAGGAWALPEMPVATPSAGVHYSAEAFSVNPPSGQGWRVLAEAAQGLIFSKRGEDAADHTFVAMVRAEHADRPITTAEELKAYFMRGLDYAKAGRYRNVDQKSWKPATTEATLCVGSHTTMEDPQARRIRDVPFLVGDAYDLECVHPGNDRLVVWMQFSERGGSATPSPELAAEAEKFFAGIHFYQPRTLQEWRQLAEKGDPNAQVFLGHAYAAGWKVAEDEGEAAKWYRKAADQGYAVAQHHLGTMYLTGRGVEKSDAEALKWYRKAADHGYAAAQGMLGLMYESGRGVPKDDAEAARWYRKAADQGDAEAQWRLGYMYEEGWGVTKDRAEAVKWYRKAAGHGEERAKEALRRLGP